MVKNSAIIANAISPSLMPLACQLFTKAYNAPNKCNSNIIISIIFFNFKEFYKLSLKMKNIENFIIILCNTPNIENAKQIANNLIKEKLVACVNIIPKVISIYHWENNIAEDEEATMLIKSHKSMIDDIEKNILELHPYQVPEIIALDISSSNENYYNWLMEVLGK